MEIEKNVQEGLARSTKHKDVIPVSDLSKNINLPL